MRLKPRRSVENRETFPALAPRDLIALAAVVAALAACEKAGAGASEAVIVRDSAGIRVVEYASAIWSEGSGWDVAEAPSVVIGMLDGPPEYQLYRVIGALRLGAGRILVANSGSHELRLYDADGRYLKGVGSEGGGPGEFETLAWVGHFGGDSIAAWDMGSRRLSVYDAGLEFVRSTAAGDIGFFAFLQGVLADRSFIVTGGINPADLAPLGSGRHRLPAHYHRFSADGTPLDTLGPFPGEEIVLTVGDGGFSFSTGVPFSHSSYLMPVYDRFYLVDGARPEIQVHDAERGLIELIRTPYDTRPIGRAEIGANAAHTVRRIEDAEARQNRRQALLDAPYPSAMPVFEAIRLDTQHHLWVQEYGWPRDASPTWRVFDPAGRFLGRVATPPGLRILEIGEDYVVGVASDEFDVEQVQIHALRRDEGA